MKKFLFVVIALFIAACSTINTNTQIVDTYGTMVNAFEDYYTLSQFDSICLADSISRNLNNWESLPIKDYENGANITQYIYIKSLGKNEAIYRLQKINDSTVKITKRITY